MSVKKHSSWRTLPSSTVRDVTLGGALTVGGMLCTTLFDHPNTIEMIPDSGGTPSDLHEYLSAAADSSPPLTEHSDNLLDILHSIFV